jgi:hypothetical protein
MGISTVRSPWSHEGGRATGEGLAVGRSPISSRADGQHIVRHVGKSALQYAPRRLDSDLSFQTTNARFPPGGGNRFR